MARELQGIADWRLLDVLGEGEHATVYRAVDSDDGHGTADRALKVLHPAVLHDQAEADAFRARVEVARRLSHPRIVDLHDAGEADGRPYAVFERVEGISLDDLRVKRSGRMKPAPAARVLRGVLEALAAARTADPPVSHGRLDAGDVLLTAEGDVRVTGFGAEAEPQVDLLPLARLAQELCGAWPPEVDAWIDRLQHGDDPFPDVTAALAGFPADALGEDADQEGLKGLRRAVKRVLRKREAEREASEAPAAREAPAPKAERKPPRRTSRPRRAPQAARDAARAEDEAAAAARQARRVAMACLGILLAALTIEIIRFGG